MRNIFIVIFFTAFILGCSPKVRFESTKPIKIDVTMRLDVYQHVAKEADIIEDQIEAPPQPKKSKGQPESRISFVNCAYAEGELSAEIQAVVESRKSRYDELMAWQVRGVVGENYKGLVELRKKPDSRDDLSRVEKLIADENKDRLVIYKDLAKKNNISVEEAGIAYAPRLHSRVKKGTPIEVEVEGKYQWVIKN